jgi:hypothetical protein
VKDRRFRLRSEPVFEIPLPFELLFGKRAVSDGDPCLCALGCAAALSMGLPFPIYNSLRQHQWRCGANELIE